MKIRIHHLLFSAVLLPALFATGSCKREERGFRVDPRSARRTQQTQISDLQPGPLSPAPSGTNGYEENAYALSEGERLYQAYNCVGCHAHGGGDIGPALMDDRWIYGSTPDQIFSTIVQGRPNGMPAYGGKVADFQVWQLVAYVRSLSGLVPTNAAPARTDHMQGKPPEQSMKTEQPKDSVTPKSTESPE